MKSITCILIVFYAYVHSICSIILFVPEYSLFLTISIKLSRALYPCMDA
jgi:hypothetical protein